MHLSDSQWRNLRWLNINGGKGFLRGEKVYYSPQVESPCPGSPVTWLHLVAKGLVEGVDGTLRLTEYGRRTLNPMQRPEAS